MSNEATMPFKCKIGTTNPSAKLSINILFDGNSVFQSDHVTDTVDFVYHLSDEPGEHKFEFIMSGKTAEDTKIDADGNITQDAMLSITDFVVDEIDCTNLAYEHFVYAHNFNGTGAETKEKFFGNMGCNGTVSLELNTPVYLWLLENM
jgi:hypothetical protein